MCGFKAGFGWRGVALHPNLMYTSPASASGCANDCIRQVGGVFGELRGAVPALLSQQPWVHEALGGAQEALCREAAPQARRESANAGGASEGGGREQSLSGSKASCE